MIQIARFYQLFAERYYPPATAYPSQSPLVDMMMTMVLLAETYNSRTKALEAQKNLDNPVNGGRCDHAFQWSCCFSRRSQKRVTRQADDLEKGCIGEDTDLNEDGQSGGLTSTDLRLNSVALDRQHDDDSKSSWGFVRTLQIPREPPSSAVAGDWERVIPGMVPFGSFVTLNYIRRESGTSK